MNEDRQYRIIKSDLWFNIYKKLDKNGYISLWFLWPDEKRVLNKDHARTFYHRWDAESALILAKVKDRWRTPTTSTKKSESEEKREKKSWSEL
jgi:hypothetical protein